jgi:hypothetical protein
MHLMEIPSKLLKLAKSDNSVKVLVIGGFCFLLVARYLVKEAKKELKKIKRSKYPKDVVILYRYRKGFNAPHDKPSIIQLETWLRMAKVVYEVS